MSKLLKKEDKYYGHKRHFWILMHQFGEGIKG